MDVVVTVVIVVFGVLLLGLIYDVYGEEHDG